MKTVEVDTALVPAKQRADAWRESLLGIFGPIHVESLDDESLSGRLRSVSRGCFTFNGMRYRGMSLWRSPVDVAKLDQEHFTLTLPSSRLHVVQHGRERVLEPGQIYLFNHAVTYRTRPQTEYRTESIAFPGRLLQQRMGSLEPFYDLGTGCGNPVNTQLIRAFASHLSQGVTTWTEHEYETLVGQFMDMLALFAGGAAATACSLETSTRAGHRERALKYIRAHASDSTLSPRHVAEACGISLSYLHEVFRAAGVPVEEKIFEERLEIARRMLIDPKTRGASIQTVCYDAGFNDPAHFSRKFKQRFGMTPGEMRRTAFLPPSA